MQPKNEPDLILRKGVTIDPRKTEQFRKFVHTFEYLI